MLHAYRYVYIKSICTDLEAHIQCTYTHTQRYTNSEAPKSERRDR